MSHWLAPKNRCITWRTVILSDLLYNWKRGVETVVAEYFVYLMNEMLESEKGISVKDVICEAVNVYNYKREETAGACQTCQDNDFSMNDYCPECGKRHAQS